LALEIGCGCGWLVNTAMAVAKTTAQMGKAFRLAVEAGRIA